MKVLYVASEALPFMASGGLGDVAGSLFPFLFLGAVNIAEYLKPRRTASFTISLTINIISNVTEFTAIMTMPNVLHSLQEQYLKLFLLLIGNPTSFTATIGKVH